MYTTQIYYVLSDEELIDLCKRNDILAFNEIYNRYRNFLLFSALKKINSSHIAEDMVQDIFMSFFYRRSAIKITVSLKAYFSQALKYKIFNEIRAQKVRNSYETYVTYLSINRNEFVSAYESKDIINKINGLIDKLPPKCRSVFLLSRIQEMSYKEISCKLGISISTVEKHMSKALKYIKLNLNQL